MPAEPVTGRRGRERAGTWADAAFVDGLRVRAEVFNQEFFNGRLPLARVVFFPSGAVRQLGSVKTDARRSMFVVRVARLLDGPVGDQPVEGSRFRLCDEVLVHELVHVEQFISAPDDPPHGRWFRDRMRAIGARPRACPTVQMEVNSGWLYRCPAGHEVTRLRRYGRRRVSCRRCDPRAYNPRHRLRLVGHITTGDQSE